MKSFSKLVVIGLLAAGGAHSATYHVTINGFTYTDDMPVIASFHRVKGGDRVTFEASSVGIPNHPLRFDLNDFANGGAGCDSNCTFTFDNPDTSQRINEFNYFCQNHGGAGGIDMSGSFQVEYNPDLLFMGNFETPVIPAFIFGAP